VGPRTGLDAAEKRKILPLPEIAKPTELSRLPQFEIMAYIYIALAFDIKKNYFAYIMYVYMGFGMILRLNDVYFHKKSHPHYLCGT
jgi:hypothetical protein